MSDDLREVWRDERQQLLETMRRHLVVLQRPDASASDLEAALLDLRRAAHTLKGAARVMGARRDEALAHRLETELSKPEHGQDVDKARRLTQEILSEFDLSAPEAPPREPTDRGAPAEQPDYAPRTLDSGFLRVPAQRLGDLASIAEDLSIVTARGLHAVPSAEAIERALGPLREAIGPLERAGGPHERASAALDAFVGWLTRRVGEQEGRWAFLRERTRALERTSRALRAIHFDVIGPRLESTVLDIARELGKEVRFELVGGTAELDRRVVEQLADPLVHLMRNAVDHGIEPPEERLAKGKPRQGRVSVRVHSRGAELQLTIEDDGAGIALAEVASKARELGLDTSDRALLDWIFEPGVTSRDEATAISGRGLGLDLVRTQVTALRGQVRAESVPDRGTRILIRVPADLSIARGWVVRAGSGRFVVLESSIEQAILLSSDVLRTVEGRRYAFHDGALWPLVDAVRLLEDEAAPGGFDSRPALALSVGERQLMLAVDEITAAAEFVVKPLGERIRHGGFVIGASILEDGHLACVLDTTTIARSAITEPVRETALPRAPRRVLVVDDSLTTRQLMVSILATAGYEVEAASDGQTAWERLLKEPSPEIVVSDVEMPRVNGFQLLARIKASPQTASLPVVLVTARSSDTDRRRALELGADGYVVKGRFDKKELLDVLSELLP